MNLLEQLIISRRKEHLLSKVNNELEFLRLNQSLKDLYSSKFEIDNLNYLIDEINLYFSDFLDKTFWLPSLKIKEAKINEALEILVKGSNDEHVNFFTYILFASLLRLKKQNLLSLEKYLTAIEQFGYNEKVVPNVILDLYNLLQKSDYSDTKFDKNFTNSGIYIDKVWMFKNGVVASWSYYKGWMFMAKKNRWLSIHIPKKDGTFHQKSFSIDKEVSSINFLSTRYLVIECHEKIDIISINRSKENINDSMIKYLSQLKELDVSEIDKSKNKLGKFNGVQVEIIEVNNIEQVGMTNHKMVKYDKLKIFKN